MGSVTTEIKAAVAAVDESAGSSVPAQAGPVNEQLVTAEAIAEALDPALVSRLAAQARAQGVQLLGRGGVLQQLTKRFLEAALDAFAEFSAKWERKHPAVVRLWTNAWAEMVPFLAFDVEIRRVICSTNAIESLSARLRRAVNARGHFPTSKPR